MGAALAAGVGGVGFLSDPYALTDTESAGHTSHSGASPLISVGKNDETTSITVVVSLRPSRQL
jgi:hypothetical protein